MNRRDPAVQAACRKIISALEAVDDLPYDGEPVNQLQHALQCADLARRSGRGSEMVVAALLHDVGRSPLVLNELGVCGRGHGAVAGEWLSPLVGERIAWLAAQHVPAKRYLVATDPDYEAALTETSRRTLQRRGGPMSPQEVAEFERHPWWEDAVELRRWDDLGKRPEAEVPPLEAYREDLLDVVSRELDPEHLLSRQGGSREAAGSTE